MTRRRPCIRRLPSRSTHLLALAMTCHLEAAAVPPATMVPAPSTETRSRAAGWGDRTWLDQHRDGSTHLRESDHPHGADLLLLGDSITQSFGGEGRRTGQPGRQALTEALPELAVANQGISGDRTQHLLWRLGHDALAGREPRAIAVMIGTNNLPHDDGATIGAGIVEVVRAIREASPGSLVLLHAIPPRGTSPDDPMRRRGRVANVLARHHAARDPAVRWIDPWDALLDDRGRPRPGWMAADGVHLGPRGYVLWAKTLAHAWSTAFETSRPTGEPS